MAYKNKVYIAFDADTDIRLYRLMQAWKQNDNTTFDFNNAHELNNLRKGSSEETIKAKLRERMANTKVFVVLIGENTKNLYKFVRWEMELALKMGLPIIAVNLDGKRRQNTETCPPIIRDELVLYVSYNQKIIEKALAGWETAHYAYKKQGQTGAYVYSTTEYAEVGL